MSDVKSFLPLLKISSRAFKATLFVSALTLVIASQSVVAANDPNPAIPAVAVKSNSIFNADSDKAKDYGDLGDEASHTGSFQRLITTASGGPDKATDYGDTNKDDGSHSAQQNNLSIADKRGSGDKATDYGDLNEDGSHTIGTTESIRA